MWVSSGNTTQTHMLALYKRAHLISIPPHRKKIHLHRNEAILVAREERVFFNVKSPQRFHHLWNTTRTILPAMQLYAVEARQ